MKPIIAEAPGRVNLLGEHTDYNDGFVLPTAIPQSTTVELRRHADSGDEFRVYSTNLNRRVSFRLDKPPRAGFARYVYGCLREFADNQGGVPPVDIYIRSAVPIGAGLSSSAALEVGLLRALRRLTQANIDDVQIAQMARRAEVTYAGVHCGIMDQMAASLADPRHMLFIDCRSLAHKLLPLPRRSEILVIDSGIARRLANSAYNLRRQECAEAARLLGVGALRDVADVGAIQHLPEPLMRRARHVISENQRVKRAVDATGRPVEFGLLMNESHASLRDDFEVSGRELDRLVGLLQQHRSIYGARLTGAGFGGACVALCRRGEARRAGQAVLRKYNRGPNRGRIWVPE